MLTGRAEVREGETVDVVFIADGPAVVDGTVRDALVALNGDVLVRGTVEEDVVAADGRVFIADGARVEGDVGYVAGAWILGRRVARRASPIVAFLAGWGILRVAALVPFLGGLAWLAAVVVALGALVVAGRRARRREVVAVGPREPEPAPPPAAAPG